MSLLIKLASDLIKFPTHSGEFAPQLHNLAAKTGDFLVIFAPDQRASDASQYLLHSYLSPDSETRAPMVRRARRDDASSDRSADDNIAESFPIAVGSVPSSTHSTIRP